MEDGLYTQHRHTEEPGVQSPNPATRGSAEKVVLKVWSFLTGTDSFVVSCSLSGCLIEEAGFFALAPALTSNDSHMKELDVSYNHPGPSGMEQLQAAMNLTHRRCRLDILRFEEFCIGKRTKI
ncbi:unnamed protein product [Menidia menidia]|uniref:(Atlantic silverside) hypothetical protein n=1 Tax=Menidia menidia TaxID=238744 RepID=A0A8S4BH00_9TELE|nr:unnamed protein product [Menidia menidia]